MTNISSLPADRLKPSNHTSLVNIQEPTSKWANLFGCGGRRAMGHSLNSSLKLKAIFKNRIDDFLSDAIHFKKTHEEILQARNVQLFLDKRWNKNFPHYHQEYLRGYFDARMGELYRSHLEWRLYILKSNASGWKVLTGNYTHPDMVGLLLSPSQCKMLCLFPGNESFYQHVDMHKSCHTWIDRPDKPY